jgi:hypothetical protein
VKVFEGSGGEVPALEVWRGGGRGGLLLHYGGIMA